MGCCCSRSSRQNETEVNQINIKVVLPKIVFDLTAGRLSENVKYCLCGSMSFVWNKVAQGGGLQKCSVYTTSVSSTIKKFGHLTQLA